MAKVIDMTARRTLAQTTETMVKQTNIVEQIRPLLADEPPLVVGTVLAELVAIYIASHAPKQRKQQRKKLLELIHQLVPLIIEEMIHTGRAPERWR